MLMVTLTCSVILAGTHGGKSQPPTKATPTALGLSGVTQNGTLTVRCAESPRPGVFRCTFSEMVLEVPSDADVRREAAAFRAEMEKEPSRIAIFRKACPATMQDIQSLEQAARTPEIRQGFQVRREAAAEACACTTDSCVRDAWVKRREVELRACKVRSTQLDVELTQAGPNKWLSTTGPGGPCNVVTSTVVAADPEKPWIKTVTRIVLSADDKDPTCKTIGIDVPIIHSSHPTSEVVASCPTIQMVP
jgi:hypothetical protein